MKDSCRCSRWQLLYIPLFLTWIRIHLLATQCILFFCTFSKVTATVSIYVIRPLIFLTETECHLRGTNWGNICIWRFPLVLIIKCCYVSWGYLPASFCWFGKSIVVPAPVPIIMALLTPIFVVVAGVWPLYV